MTQPAWIKSWLNPPLIIGLAMVAGGLLTAHVFAAAVYEAMPALDFPDAANGDLVDRFVIYTFALLLQASGPVLLHVFGLSVTAVGAITALIGLVQAIIQSLRGRTAKRAEAPGNCVGQKLHNAPLHRRSPASTRSENSL